MVARALLAAALLAATAGCGGGEEPETEVRLLAPVALVGDVKAFQDDTGCHVDLRIYDADEDIAAIAERRNVDVVARPVRAGETPDDTVELVRITIARDLEITVPRSAAGAFEGPTRPAGNRRTRWEIREGAPNPACARRWLAYATSQ